MPTSFFDRSFEFFKRDWTTTKIGKFSAYFLILIIALIGIGIYQNYGLSSDELVEAKMPFWHLKNFLSGEHWREIPYDSEYYGLFFNAISTIPYLLIKFIQNPDESFYTIMDNGLQTGDFYLAKHLFTFLFSLIAYLSVAWLMKDLTQWSFAASSVVILALTPNFWGHAFYNPKDIPFAVIFTVVSYGGARFTHHLWQQQGPLSKKTIAFAVLFGLLVGLLTSIRIGGFVILGFGVMVLGVLHMTNQPRQSWKTVIKYVMPYFYVILSWAIVTVLLMPVAWQAPHVWFFEAISYLSDHAWSFTTLTFGQYWLGQDTPWFYLPVWLGITTPLLTLLLAGVGWLGLVLRFLKLSNLQRSICVWLNLQFLMLPMIAILQKSTVYNGIRQFLFVLPPMAVLAATGLAACLSSSFPRLLKQALLVAVFIGYSAVAVEMFKLHPYEATYFNSFVRTPDIAEKFETDYWGLSVKEAIEWVNRQPEPQKIVFYSAKDVNIQSFADASVVLNQYDSDVDPRALPESFYYLATPRNKYGVHPHPQDNFPDCEIVFQVQRPLGNITLPLTLVRYCHPS